MGDIVSERKKFFEGLGSGQKHTFVKAGQKFYLRLKMTDPNDGAKLVDLPQGIRVRLMANGSRLKNAGATALTDAQGKVCLAPDSATIASRPDYHFRIDLDERTYIDIDTLKPAPSKAIKPLDARKLMEIPMVVDTAEHGFYYDESKLALTDGKLKNYDPKKSGEGSDGDPIVLELRFYWYFLKFKYHDRIKNEWRDVPAGMPIVPRLETDSDYLHRYLLKSFLELGYVLDSEAKKIQHHLNLLGFACGKVDGIVGAKTRAGIRAFQKQYDLKVDGIAGPITQRTLEQAFYRRQIGVYKDNAYAVPVWKKKNAAWTELFFETAQPGRAVAGGSAFTSVEEAARFDLFLYTADKDATPALRTREQIASENPDKDKKPVPYEKLDFLRRRLYYDLPTAWSCRNYWTRYDNDMDKGERFQTVMKDKLKLFPFDAGEAKRAQAAKPLIFSLDDIVLAQTNRDQTIGDQAPDGSALALDANSRYTLFCIDYDTQEDVGGTQKNRRRLKIHKPETAQPVFTDAAFKENLITTAPGHTRLICFCNGLYDATDQRAKANDPGFDAAKQHVAGARLAILNDPRVHRHKAVNAGTAGDIAGAYALGNCGNYELHYLHDCAELDGKPLGYLLIYWNCRLQSINQDAWARPVTPGGAAGIADHRKFGMTNAMARLNKDYLIERHSGAADVFIRPFHFMEAKNDTNGGPHKAMVNIVTDNSPNGGAWMTIANAQLRLRDYQSDPTYFGNPDPDNALQDSDGKTYAVLTNHHEMGHATGNWDDYLYDCEDLGQNWFRVPRYNQPFTAEGGPYSGDKLSRMNVNRTPRLRNFWKFACWLNDEAQAGKALEPLLGRTRFRIAFQGTAHCHQFELADTYRNVALAAKTGRDQTVKDHARADLLLYKLGDDEYSRLAVAGQVFNAVLVVKSKIAVNFRPAGAVNWNTNNAIAWAQQLHNQIKTDLNQKFRIATARDNDFKNILLLFSPAYNMLTNAAPADQHINLQVENRTGRAPAPQFQQHAVDRARLDIDRDTDIRRAVRFCFGETAGNAALAKEQFAAIVTWVKTQCGADDYAIHDL